jgi:hypothetical protein
MPDDVARRVADLDDAMHNVRAPDALLLAGIFVEVLADIGFRGTPDTDADVLSPAYADEVTGRCRLLHELEQMAPWLEGGPSVGSCRQRWIATGQLPRFPPRTMQPDPGSGRKESIGTTPPRSPQPGLAEVVGLEGGTQGVEVPAVADGVNSVGRSSRSGSPPGET